MLILLQGTAVRCVQSRHNGSSASVVLKASDFPMEWECQFAYIGPTWYNGKQPWTMTSSKDSVSLTVPLEYLCFEAHRAPIVDWQGSVR